MRTQTLADMTPLEKRNLRLYEHLAKAGSVQPTLTISKILAFVFAMLWHGITILCIGEGLFLLATGLAQIVTGDPRFGVLRIVFSLLMFGFAWGFAPRFGNWPKMVLPRDQFPAVYHLADQI